jgi:DNA adenine methylase
MRPAIKYFGGKHYQAKHIISLMPPHNRYAEAFFGGGAVLFAKECEGVAEYVNDKNWALTNFWKVLSILEYFDEFKRQVEATPFSKYEFENAQWLESFKGAAISVPYAVWFFIRNRQSRQGLGRDFATPTTRLRAGMNENVSAWLSAVEGLPEVHARLKRVEIWNEDAITFIDKLDKSYDTLFYLDPPYVHETRTATDAYQFEMSLEQHKELLLYLLRGMRGKVMISGYPNELYDTMLTRERGWRYVDLEIDNKSSSSAVKEMKIERAWMNYER